MPMKASIYITDKSIKELERAANQLIKEVHEGETKILLEAARYIQDGIKQNIAKTFIKRTGNLAGSTYAKAYPPTMSKSAIAFAGIRPRKAPHAHLLEFGTVQMKPHEFVKPAIDDRKGPAMDMIISGLKKTVEGAV